MELSELQEICATIRRDIVNMVSFAGSGHPGGALSATELMVSLYFNHMRIDPENPQDPDRDRFVLSKGHSAPCLYALRKSIAE